MVHIAPWPHYPNKKINVFSDRWNRPTISLRLLAYSYSNQKMHVRNWQTCVSSPFSVGNGVRQGGILVVFSV